VDLSFRRVCERRVDASVEAVRELRLLKLDKLVCFVAVLDRDDLEFRDICAASLSMCRIMTQAAAITKASRAMAPPMMPPS
jgi:hypothetical protein